MAWSERSGPSPARWSPCVRDDRPHLGASGQGVPLAGAASRSRPSSCGDEEDGAVVLRMLDRMGRGKDPAGARCRRRATGSAWTLFEHEQRGGPKLPDPEDTPWTHGGPPRGDAAESPDPVTPEDLL